MNPNAYSMHSYPPGWDRDAVNRIYATKVAYEAASNPQKVEIAENRAVPVEQVVKSPIKEGTMCKSVLNKLNGIAPGEESLIVLEQDYSEAKFVTIDLAKVLSESSQMKALKPGEACLITDVKVDMNTGRLAIGLSQGPVTKVETAAVLGHFQKLLTSAPKA